MAQASSSSARGGFGSRLGFILAAAGSAIGLGNIWRFPYACGEHGGAAFIVVYLVCVVVLCIPVLFAELAIGRAAQRNPVGAFARLAPGTWWPAVGGLGVLTGFAILAFYSVVAGWTVNYLLKALRGGFGHTLSAEESEQIFGMLTGSELTSSLFAAGFIVLTALVVRGGVAGGIERAAKILMPVFLVLLVGLALRSVTLPGGEGGLRFLFMPDFSKITVGVVMGALGQALFSLSLGMGAMITYGSYLSGNERLPGAGVAVAFADTGIAMLAGLMIFPALFAAGGEPQGGAGLVFVVLPTIFGQLPMGALFSIAFYGLLAVAALTSTVSLLEVVVSYFVDQRAWKRERATWIVALGCILLALPSAVWTDFLEWQSVIFGNYALGLGAIFISLFVGWKWGIRNALDEIARGGQSLPLAGAWSVLIRFVCPLAVAAIVAYMTWTGEFH